ncbi:hypothetical protein JMJ77_0013650 [Colletotrichum scovillei]|uniref:Uncharacterized protein n=1 Tax=Colletotrichum scovillei TaxID=1209932 RepID=A0A9P7QT56_9PEZI|nr:hypothetical protein JMJ78_0012939 [Colletotrichum scovillei]KAG7040653.1 hypothetical protein JMJ77_0013650 [Colletotrichum scovillei]KAG7060700.1 hypothetical protein JMJ76_0006243 [Colletotrichum scovillei]
MQLDDSQGIKRDPEHELATRKHWETFFSGAYPDTWLRYQDEAQHGVIGAQTDTIDTRYEAWMKCTEDFEEWERREKENKEKAVQPPTSVTRT